jgi:predicted helicase
MKSWLYLDSSLVDEPGIVGQLLDENHMGLGMVVIAPRPEAQPAVLMIESPPDQSFYTYTGQFFARWRYTTAVDATGGELVEGRRKVDNISDAALRQFVAAYGTKITKDDVFFYVYGILHSSRYRETYESDLRKMFPRIPLVEDPWPFIEGGRRLSNIHVGYESVAPYRLGGLDLVPEGDPFDFYRVVKMSYAKVRGADGKLGTDRTTIIYNSRIALSGIPSDAYRYQLGSRCAIDWVVERYQLRTDAASGIVNDPNDWSREVGNPRYILDLLARIVTVSVETMKIVDGLPPLQVRP